jgi:hypothetical protein
LTEVSEYLAQIIAEQQLVSRMGDTLTGFSLLDTAKTVYVDGALGDDDNDGLTAAAPKKTITDAIDAIPMFRGGAWTVSVAGGTLKETVTVSNKYALVGTIITIQGTETSIETGTVASAANYHEITDSSKTWDTDEHKGRFCRVTSGTYEDYVFPIMGNTADTLDITYLDADIAVGVTFEIFEPATTIDGENSRESCVEAYGPALAVKFKNLKIVNSTAIGARAEDGCVALYENCYFENHPDRHGYSVYMVRTEYRSCYFKGNATTDYGIYGGYIPQLAIYCGFDGFSKSGGIAAQFYMSRSGLEYSSVYNCNRGLFAMGSGYIKVPSVYLYNCTYSVYGQFGTVVYLQGCNIDSNSIAGAEGVRSELFSQVYVYQTTFANCAYPLRKQLQGEIHVVSPSGSIATSRFEADYESNWTSCTASAPQAFAHAFGFIPKDVEVLWGDNATPTTVNKDASTWAADATNITITPAQTKYYKVRAFMR